MNNLKEICSRFSFTRLFHYNNIPNNKLENAIMQLGINNDEIVVFYDGTIWQTGKNGMAICEGGLYWKNLMEEPRYLSWNQFKKLRLNKVESYIYLGEENRIFVYESEVEKVFSLLDEIRMTIKIDNFAEKTVGFLSFLEKAANFIGEIGQELNDNNVSGGIIEESPSVISDNNLIEAEVIEIEEDVNMWMIAGKDFRLGPYSTDDVKRWLNDNKTGLDKIYIWKKGMEKWELVNDMPEFGEYIKKNTEMPPLPSFD